MSTTISVIVPTRNRRAALQRCLDSLAHQTRLPDQVVVVDNAGTDGTYQSLRKRGRREVEVVRHQRNRGRSASRNTGIKRATGQIVAFIDDDCVADRHWLAELESTFADPGVGMVIGAVHYVSRGHRGYFPEKVVENRRAEWPMTCNLAVRRSLLGKGFDRKFDRFHNEDTELAVRLVSEGVRFARHPAAMVYHQAGRWTARSLLASAGNPSVWPVLKRRYPEHYRAFGRPLHGFWRPRDYLLLAGLPLLIIPLLVRYVWHGQRHLGLFFAKWPVLLILIRLRLWRESLRQRRLVL